MWSNIVFGVCLLAVSIGMLFRHRQAWQSVVREGLSDHALDYLYRQYQRRTQASALIGAVGLAILAGVWVSGLQWMLVFWSAVSLLVVWMGCLALADLLSTRSYFNQVHQDHEVEQAVLQEELDRLLGRESNGRARESRESNQNEEDI